MPLAHPPAVLQVFYDGECPLCQREVRHYMKRDRNHRVEWVDIALPTFHAEVFGLDAKRVHEVMHARTADGQVFTEVQAFIQIWKALPPTLMTTAPVAVLKIPGMLALANVFYRLFARNRYRLTGRCTPKSCDPAIKR